VPFGLGVLPFPLDLELLQNFIHPLDTNAITDGECDRETAALKSFPVRDLPPPPAGFTR
jgi:hypothetical protein